MFFQERLGKVLRLLEGVLEIADEILTHGKNKVQHDGRLLALFKTEQLNNLTFNLRKMQFKSRDCEFFRHRLTPQTIKPDTDKIQAILAMKPPESVSVLYSFNGMANYLKQFSSVLTELLEPLRRLCKQGAVCA